MMMIKMMAMIIIIIIQMIVFGAFMELNRKHERN